MVIGYNTNWVKSFVFSLYIYAGMNKANYSLLQRKVFHFFLSLGTIFVNYEGKLGTINAGLFTKITKRGIKQ